MNIVIIDDDKLVTSALKAILETSGKVTVVDVDNYLKGHPAIYSDFVKNNGIEYLQDAEDFGVLENFSYYYTTLKKYNAIKDLQKEGFDTSDIYPTDMLDPNQEDKLKKFDSMTIQMIFESVRSKLVKIEGEYNAGTNTKVCYANEGIDALLDGLAASPEIGVNLPGETYNTIVRGARKGKFYLQSSGTGVGKTRSMIADACNIACGRIYDADLGWITLGKQFPTLFIGTEQDKDEIQTMMLSFLSNVNEEHILNGHYEGDERQRVFEAARLIKEAPLFIEVLPEFNMQDVENVIKRKIREKNVQYIFHDYIHTSIKILEEISRRAGKVALREDNILFMLSARLKDICVKYNVFIMSATQLNGDYKDAKTPDQNLLRGAKAIADKIDYGSILLPVTDVDLASLENVLSKNPNFGTPTIKLSIYKNRRGKYKGVILWCTADLGTCRIQPVFLTNFVYEMQPIENIKVKFEDESAF